MKKGNLVRHKHNGTTGTIMCDPYTKLYMECDRWGNDISYAATVIRVLWHDGWERVYKFGDFRRNHEVIENSLTNLEEANNA